MSMQPWLDEFIPANTELTTLTWAEATDAAIKAREGRKEENLKKHKISIELLTHCLLCCKDDLSISEYLDENPNAKIDDCVFCPIQKAVGETCGRIYASKSPTRVEDMLSILRKTKEYLQTHPNHLTNRLKCGEH